MTLQGHTLLRWAIAVVAVAIVGVAIVVSKRRPVAVGEDGSDGGAGPLPGAGGDDVVTTVVEVEEIIVVEEPPARG